MRKNIIYRKIALSLCICIVSNVVLPAVSWALTSGPKQPEFSNFQPVTTTDMVNTFTGDFNYNIPILEVPGPHGSGYPLSLAYNSGLSPEDEASWVGWGWSLNPGGIDRNLRGYPDDYSTANNMTFYNKAAPNWSLSAVETAGFQIMSKVNSNDNSKAVLGVGLNNTLRYNNNSGMHRAIGISASIAGMVDAGINFSAEGITYSANINPSISSIKFVKAKEKIKNAAVMSPEALKSRQNAEKHVARQANSSINSNINASINAAIKVGSYVYSDLSSSVNFPEYSGVATTMQFSTSIFPGPIPIGFTGSRSGAFNGQKNTPRIDKKVLGYMSHGSQGEESMKDYYVEKSSEFSSRDKFIGMPFHNSDLFSVTGEGIGGSFHYVPLQQGVYSPAPIDNTSAVFNLGLRLGAGTAFSVGLSLGGGVTKNKISKWENVNSTATSSEGYFRFLNDAGNTDDQDASLNRVGLSLDSRVPGFKSVNTINPTEETVRGIKKNISRSSVIEEKKPNGALDGFVITNEQGVKYHYTYPNKVHKHSQMQLDIYKDKQTKRKKEIINDYLVKDLETEYSVNKDLNIDNYTTVQGQVNNTPYASSFLLKEIQGYNYIDADNSLASNNGDLGAWTKFDYHEASKNYEYRIPYDGSIYMDNSISNTEDDLGSVQSGTRDLNYLKSIETPTHIAYFVTNKTTPARFGNDIDVDLQVYLTPNSSQPRLDARSKNNVASEFLDKIVLVSKNRPNKPLKVIRFQYSNKLCKGLPNATGNTGKLTLEKVWFEYEGLSDVRTSPYIFDYEYKKSSLVTNDGLDPSLAKNNEFISSLDEYATGDAQNPNYAPEQLDAWGKYQINGKEQQALRRKWLDQRPARLLNSTNANSRMSSSNTVPLPSIGKKYDPAAWHLKQIQLPSGGEILVRYEEKNYTHVQDRKVMALGSVNSFSFDEYSHSEFFVNMEDLGIDEIPGKAFEKQKEELLKRMNEFYGADGMKERIYYKLLFSRNGAPESNPTFKDRMVEYIQGYGELKPQKIEGVDQIASFTVKNGRTYLKLVINGRDIEGSSEKKTMSPRQAAYDFFSTQRLGFGDFAFYDNQVSDALSRDNLASIGTVLSVAKDVYFGGMFNAMFSNIYNLNDYGIPNRSNICKSISHGESKVSRSYFKLPLIGAKRGGGVRVKALYTYDQGLESNAAEVYGTEYLYETSTGESSGVATNEPSEMREENPLVTYLPKASEQNFRSRLTAGIEVDNTEGPIGESLLPAASIGHSRVVTRNIHKGSNSSTGFVINEYFTVKDYPFDKQYPTDQSSDIPANSQGVEYTSLPEKMYKDKFTFPLIFLNMDKQKMWASQGFRFILNAMHGQPRKISSYGGQYESMRLNLRNGYFQVGGKEFTYCEPGEKVIGLEKKGDIRSFKEYIPGKEVEMAVETKQVSQSYFNINISVDIALGMVFPPPIITPSAFPVIDISNNDKYFVANTKVIRYPAILKKTVDFQEGVAKTSEMLYFNLQTGKPMCIKTYDEFAGTDAIADNHAVYTLSIPASWENPLMGKKDENPANQNLIGEVGENYVCHGQNPIDLDIPNRTFKYNFEKIENSNNVLQASISKYSSATAENGWYADETDDAIFKQLKSKWHMSESYVYKTDDVATRDAENSDIRTAGRINKFVPFNYSAQNKNWTRTEKITKYSIHGEGLEMVDVLNNPSAIKYGYQSGLNKDILLTMQSSNASYASIYFEDFETSSTASQLLSHSGKKSLNASTYPITGITADRMLVDGGGLFRVWIYEGGTDVLSPKLIANGNNFALERVATVSGWSLYKGLIRFAKVGAAQMSLTLGADSYIDDVRFEPRDAQSTCYSYDPVALREVARFDAQHFGLYAQYNAEGKLVRRIVETERGKQTVQETHYHSRAVVR